MATIGDTLELLIEDLTVEGGGLARPEGKGGRVVFTDRGLPGERVLARLTRVKTRFAVAVVEKTLAPSPTAEAPHCPHAGTCGGCAWPGLPYAEEVAWKERQLRETLRRVGGVDEALLQDPDVFLPLIPAPSQTGYRNKLEFAFGGGAEGQGSGAFPGLRVRGSHEVLWVDTCPLAAFPHRELLETVRKWASSEGLEPWREGGKGSGFLRHLVLRRSGTSCIAELITAPCGYSSREQKAVERLADMLFPGSGSEDASPNGLCAGFIHSLRAQAASVAYGEVRRLERGETAMEEELAGSVFRAEIPAFLQINTAAASLLYETARDFARHKSQAAPKTENGMLDLYCGVGGLAVTLARMPEFADVSVTGVDNVETAINAARANAEQNGVSGACFETADSAAYLSGLAETPALVIADPPRAGLPPDVTAALLHLAPARILLVSCNPATLARDVAGLLGRYTLRRVRGVDLFPRTTHVESVVLLEKSPE